jgi:EAL and modified HD-GYP domain-containing signal transduction protein
MLPQYHARPCTVLHSPMNQALSSVPTASIFLARQAILDRERELFAYELLFRDGRVGHAQITNANAATTRLLTNTFLEFGIETISDNKPVFINLPRDYVTGALPLPLDPKLVVLEILEDVSADAAALAGIASLRQRGFTIALDDFVLGESRRALLDSADLVKIDIRQFTPEALAREVQHYAGLPVKLLAEKVETHVEFEFCHKLGFDYFQGYFFSKPVLMEGRELPAGQMTLLNLIAKLQTPATTFAEIEALISNDVGISYKLLRIINSSLYNLSRNVESIQHAVVLLGTATLKKWLTLLSLSAVANKPPELVNQTLIRARMCEELARSLNLKPESAFTVGLFSQLDALMDTSLHDLIAALPLAPEISAAITARSGGLGALLQTVEHYERGAWQELDRQALTAPELLSAWQSAVAWQRQLREQLALA